MSKFHRLGRTKTFSRGKISDDDEGDLQLAITAWRGTVRIDFGTDLSWLSMPPDRAREFAAVLLKAADEVAAKAPGN